VSNTVFVRIERVKKWEGPKSPLITDAPASPSSKSRSDDGGGSKCFRLGGRFYPFRLGMNSF
jgi:hypothetical protein